MNRPKYREKYRQYALKGGKVPRSTLHSRRKRQEEERKKREAEEAQKAITFQEESQTICGQQQLERVTDCERRQSEQYSDSSSSEVYGCGLLVTQAQRKKKKVFHQSPPPVTIPLVSSDSGDDSIVEEPIDFSSSPPLSNGRCTEELDSVSASNITVSPTVPSGSCNQEGNPKPLCPCISTTGSDIHFMVLNLGLKHGLTWQAQTDILKMFGTIYGNDKIPVTKHSYLKDISTVEKDISYHISCSACEAYLGERNSLDMVMECLNEDCKSEITVGATEELIVCEKCNIAVGHKKDLNLILTKCTVCSTAVNVKKVDNFFLSISMESQFKTYLRDSQFVDHIMTYRFRRQTDANCLSDIYDGKVYKNLFESNGVLSDPLNFSYSFFIDGMAYGNTSNKTIWPIYLTINELPYEERSNHIVLAGLYVGPKDPNVQTFLQPFTIEARRLSEQGFSWELNGRTVTSRVIALCCIADSVARCKILNFQSFTAIYGCTFCYNHSERTRVGRRFTVGEVAQLRTNDSLREDLREIYERRDAPKPEDRVYKGVKGFSQVLTLDHFEISANIVVDYMHNILLGCTKHHLELILDSTRKKMWIGMDDERIGVEHIIKSIDDRLDQVQSTTSVIRELRQVKHMKLWRASEFRLWLIFYALPCLKDLLKDKYLRHFALLSKAAFILLQQNVVIVDVKEAHHLLMLYTFYFQQYFGKENMRYNIHLLSHVANGVFNFGPLWTHNSFLYEAENKYMRKLSKNPQSVILEIAKKFLIYRSLPLLSFEMVKTEQTLTFCDELFNQRRLKKFFRFDEDCILLGAGEPYVFTTDDLRILPQYVNNLIYSCYRYKRMVYKRRRYCTSNYCEATKNNDSCVLLSDGQFAIISKIWLLPQNKIVLVGEKLYVSRKLFEIREHSISIDHIHKFEMSTKMLTFTPNQIAGPCMLIVTPNGNYVSSVPYGCSVE